MKETSNSEEWRDIEGYEGMYQVSNFGRVKSLKGEEKVLSDFLTDSGYLQIILHKEGKRKRFFVHRLVAESFIRNPNFLPYVNHKDENGKNNRWDNLEWCTALYNTNYGTAIKRRSRKRKKKVAQCDLQGSVIKIWESAADCVDEGFSNKAISKCCTGQKKTYKGYKWFHYPVEKEGVI